MSYSLVLGSYVSYKGEMHIALGYANGLVKLINPLNGNRKVNVKRDKVTTTSNKCVFVSIGNAPYLVTAKDIIISLDTYKIRVNKGGDLMEDSILSAANEVRDTAVRIASLPECGLVA